jgi:hypothetical protein
MLRLDFTVLSGRSQGWTVRLALQVGRRRIRKGRRARVARALDRDMIGWRQQGTVVGQSTVGAPIQIKHNADRSDT